MEFTESSYDKKSMRKGCGLMINKWMVLVIALVLGTQMPGAVHADPLPLYADIIIDAGHGGIDGGTSYQGILEKDINLEIALLTYQLLKKKNSNVILNRTGDYALSDHNHWLHSRSRHRRDLAQRKELAVEIKPLAMVSLHVNWSRNRDARGPIVLHQQNEASIKLAEHLQNSLNKVYGTKKKPVLGKTYYLLNRTDCPTVIVEMGHLSNAQDREMLTSKRGKKAIAAAIAEGLLKYREETISLPERKGH